MEEDSFSRRRLPGRHLSPTIKKSRPKSTRNVRSFLGLKNPWFGKKIYESNQATVWSKTLITNADAEFPVKATKTEKFYQADKKVSRREEPVKTSAYLGRGSSQGRLDEISEKIDKNMTVEQVREILNKNR